MFDEAGTREVIHEVLNERVCPHGKRKYDCKHCGGKRYCAHGKQKALCRECGGSGLCVHDKRKASCKSCLFKRFGSQ